MSAKLQEIYTKVAQHADLETIQVGAADCSRVLGTFFKVMAGLNTSDAASVISQGLRRATDVEGKVLQQGGRRRKGAPPVRQPKL